MKDLCLLSANELVERIKTGTNSSLEVCQSYIDRIEKFEKDVKAWAYFDKKYLLEKAKQSDEYRLSGKPIGSLHGLPIAVKDIVGTNDMPTTCGTKIRKGARTRDDAFIISLLISAGAIIMGKTVTTEFAYFDPGSTTNPHDYTRTPGGSSSGSAAAVASFMAPLAIGSQTNGSMIRPASYCGVVGFKPSYGLISRQGILKQSFFLDQVGVFSRNIEDVALITKVLIKKDSMDSSTTNYSSEDMYDTAISKPPFDQKFIFFKTSNWKNINKNDQKIFEKFLSKNEKIIKVEDSLSYFEDIFKYHKIIHETDMAYSFKDYYNNFKKQLGSKLVEAIERGMTYKSSDYVEALEYREFIYNDFKEIFNDYHGILTPSSTGVAPKGLESTGSPEFSTIWTYLGLPSISLPILKGSNNLPLGIQLIGEKLDDARTLRTANWLMKEVGAKI